MDKRCQNQGPSVSLGEVSTESGFRRSVSRCGDGMISKQAFVRNMGTCRPDVKGEALCMLQSESTKAGHRGGLSRSSDEVSVMEMERRVQPVRSRDEGQPFDGRNLRIETKPFNITRSVFFDSFLPLAYSTKRPWPAAL